MAITKAGTTVVGSNWHADFKFVSASGLDVTFSGGKFSNSFEQIVNITINTTLTLQDDAVNKIYIDFNGNPKVNVEDLTHSNKLLIYEITTGSGAVAAIIDRRAPASSVTRERSFPAAQGRINLIHAITVDSTANQSTWTSDEISYASFLDKWHFMVITKQSGAFDRKIYLDGTELSGTFADIGTIDSESYFADWGDTNDTNVTFGKVRPSSNSQFWDGWIANTGFTEEVLTPANIAALIATTSSADFDTELGNYNLDHYWDLQEASLDIIDQGTWGTLHDLTTAGGSPVFREDGPHDTSDGSWWSIRYDRGSGTTGEYHTNPGWLDFKTNFSNRAAGSFFTWFKPGSNTFLGSNVEHPFSLKDTSLSVPSEYVIRFERLLEGSP